MSFDREWDKQTIMQMVDKQCYLEFGKHEDLKALCVCPHADEETESDYEELTFVVPKNWLEKFCKEKFEVEDLDAFLQEQYTSEQSEIIFENALEERQLVLVDFD